MIEVTRLQQADRPRWTELWRAYLDFYHTTMPEQVYDHTWSRLLAGEELHGLTARADGTIVGITHFLFHPSAWTLTPVCYLQDLFTGEAARGKGIGRALINGVYDQARHAGCGRVYWQTHETNRTAMQLYDKVAERSGFVVYRKLF